MGISLTFVAIVTPYEVAFLDAPTVDSLGTLFVANRLIDFLFFIDMCIIFNLAVRSFDSANNFTQPSCQPMYQPARRPHGPTSRAL
jgi:hypothetical protein